MFLIHFLFFDTTTTERKAHVRSRKRVQLLDQLQEAHHRLNLVRSVHRLHGDGHATGASRGRSRGRPYRQAVLHDVR